MKKNVMLKIASVLMIAVLLTTCAISGTFAKYVTEVAAKEDTAKVAKWGVELTTTLDGLFSKTYESETSDYTLGDDTVISSHVTDKVLAPGTKGGVAALSTVSGKPEVAVRVETTADLVLTGWTEGCPLVFQVGDVKYAVGTASDSTETMVYVADTDALEAAVESAIKATGTVDFEPNTDLATKDIFGVNISWEWSFAGNDTVDTALGNAAAGIDGGVASEVKLVFGQKITQLN